MKFIFSSLPDDIIKNILLYDDHFIMRKGEIVSIIPKKDVRYSLLKYITFNIDYIEHFDNVTICRFFFPNLYNYEVRRKNNPDLIMFNLQEENNTLTYSVWIGKQYPKSFTCSKEQCYYIDKPEEYHWVYMMYKYIRT